MIRRSTIVVDVGNSAIKMAAAADDQPSCGASAPALHVLRVNLREPAWKTVLARQIEQLRTRPAGSAPLRWVVASVNGPASHALRQQIVAERPDDSWLELSHGDVPVRVELRRPEAVGIDRLLSASAAWHAATASSANACSAVISIDAGSAVTVDLVRAGAFVGGAILPGLRLQLASLTQGTDRLPPVSCDPGTSLEVPGRDTVAAIRAGVVLGLSGGIDRLIERYSHDCPQAPRVFLTGGDAAVIEPLLRHDVSRRDDLVLSAIADIAAAPGYHG